MKYVRFFAVILLILCTLLSVVACDEDDNPSKDTDGTTSAPEDPSDSADKPIGDITGSTTPTPDTDNIQVSNPLGLNSLDLSGLSGKSHVRFGRAYPRGGYHGDAGRHRINQTICRGK